MNGFYLYCIREKQNQKFDAKGLFENSQAFALRVNKLEAVVSEVPLDQMGQEQIRRKAQEDVVWIKEMALRHESVIEKAMKVDGQILPVIPMRFGTVFLTQENLEQTLLKDYLRYWECLNQLKLKQEWSVKLYLTDHEPFQTEILKTDPLIMSKKKEVETMPTGMAYFFQSELNDLIRKSMEIKIDSCVESVFRSLENYACLSVRGKLLEKEFTGRGEPMILNAIYLILEHNISAFKQEVAQHRATLKVKGLQLEYGGPWPPYHFSKVQ